MNTTQGTLRVARISTRDIGIRGLEVYLDGEFLVNLRHGREFETALEPGEHTLRATNSLYKREERFTLEPGQMVSFEVANVVTGLGKLLMTVGGGLYRVELRRTG